MTNRCWMPARYRALAESWLVEWVPAPRQSIGSIPSLQTASTSGRLFMSPVQVRAALRENHAADPSLFIFHVSRCGSTLLARLLGADPSLRVCIEPPLLASFLAQSHAHEEARFRRELRTMMSLCGLGAPKDERLVIKFTSHALHRVDAIRSVYPDVPAVLVYRDPRAILARLQANPPDLLRHRPRWLRDLVGMSTAEAALAGDDTMAAAYVRELFRAAAASAGSFDRLVDYRDLPHAVEEIRTGLLDCAGGPPPAGTDRIAAEHSKYPGRPYSAESEGEPAPDVAALAKMALPFYEWLDRIRSSSSAGRLAGRSA